MIDNEKIYSWITEEGEERICEAIDEEQCTDVPGNFIKNSLSGFCSKLAEQLVSPGVTLPWILNIIGASPGLIGFLVPIKNAGSLLPQLIVSAKIRAFSRRKLFWSLSALFQALMISLMLMSVIFLEGDTAGYVIISALFLFSIASGVASVSFKDVMAKTIPKGRRGGLLATRATGGGILTLLAGMVMYFFLQSEDSKFPFLLLIGLAILLWILSAFFFSLIKEEPGATSGGRSPVEELGEAWNLFITNTNLRNFIITRALLMAIPLVQPFLIIYGKEITNASFNGLGLMVIVSGIAGFISSPFWGKFADKSSRKMMMVVAGLGIINLMLVVGFKYIDQSFQSIMLYSLLILLNMIIYSGARLSRKTYLTDLAPEEERPLYISLSNTCIGLFTILTAGIGFIAEIFSIEIMFLFFMGMLFVSILVSYKLKEV